MRRSAEDSADFNAFLKKMQKPNRASTSPYERITRDQDRDLVVPDYIVTPRSARLIRDRRTMPMRLGSRSQSRDSIVHGPPGAPGHTHRVSVYGTAEPSVRRCECVRSR